MLLSWGGQYCREYQTDSTVMLRIWLGIFTLELEVIEFHKGKGITNHSHV
jgi:hypothetical protein